MTGTRSQPKHLFATQTNRVGADSALLRAPAPNRRFSAAEVPGSGRTALAWALHRSAGNEVGHLIEDRDHCTTLQLATLDSEWRRHSFN